MTATQNNNITYAPDNIHNYIQMNPTDIDNVWKITWKCQILCNI